MNISSSTIAGNSGGSANAIGVGGSGNVFVRDTIIISSGTDCTQNSTGQVVSQGHNIGSDSSCNLTASGDQPNTNPQLGPLADNGGPTLTHAITSASPAFDAGSDGCPGADQRGVVRPQAAACDIGAFELDLEEEEESEDQGNCNDGIDNDGDDRTDEDDPDCIDEEAAFIAQFSRSRFIGGGLIGGLSLAASDQARANRQRANASGTAAAATPAAAASAPVRPPSTGDGGLLEGASEQ